MRSLCGSVTLKPLMPDGSIGSNKILQIAHQKRQIDRVHRRARRSPHCASPAKANGRWDRRSRHKRASRVRACPRDRRASFRRAKSGPAPWHFPPARRRTRSFSRRARNRARHAPHRPSAWRRCFAACSRIEQLHGFGERVALGGDLDRVRLAARQVSPRLRRDSAASLERNAPTPVACPSPSRTSSNSGGHCRTVSISRSYHAQPARIASARWISCFAIVPRYRPPASGAGRSRSGSLWRRLGQATEETSDLAVVGRASQGEVRRASLHEAPCPSCLRMAFASGAATTAQILSVPNILCFQSFPDAFPPHPDPPQTREFLLLPCGAQCVKPGRPLS